MRFRIRVGSPCGHDLIDHVLGKFTSEEKPIVDEMVKKAAEVLLLYVEGECGRHAESKCARD